MNQRMHLAGAALALAMLGGCGEKKAPARPAPAPASSAVPAAAATTAPGPATAEAPPQEWVYSSVGKRDPFRSYLADLAAQARDSVATRCTTPSVLSRQPLRTTTSWNFP